MGVAKGLFTNYRYIIFKIMTTTVANNIVSSLSEEESFRTYNKTHMWCICPDVTDFSAECCLRVTFRLLGVKTGGEL